VILLNARCNDEIHNSCEICGGRNSTGTRSVIDKVIKQTFKNNKTVQNTSIKLSLRAQFLRTVVQSCRILCLQRSHKVLFGWFRFITAELKLFVIS